MSGYLESVTVTGSTTANLQYDVFNCDASGGSVTLTFPLGSAATNKQVFYVNRVDSTFANSVSIVGTSGQTIAGQATYTLLPRGSVTLIATATNWTGSVNNKQAFVTQIMNWNSGAAIVASGQFLQANGNTGTETFAQWLVLETGTLYHLQFFASATQTNGAIATIVVNGTPSSLSATIGAGTSSASNLTTGVAVTAGQRISLQVSPVVASTNAVLMASVGFMANP